MVSGPRHLVQSVWHRQSTINGNAITTVSEIARGFRNSKPSVLLFPFLLPFLEMLLRRSGHFQALPVWMNPIVSVCSELHSLHSGVVIWDTGPSIYLKSGLASAPELSWSKKE